MPNLLTLRRRNISLTLNANYGRWDDKKDGGDIMGTCCGVHLQAKIREYARNAQNGAVTVTMIENPHIDFKDGTYAGGMCDFCKAPAEFACSYYPK